MTPEDVEKIVAHLSQKHGQKQLDEDELENLRAMLEAWKTWKVAGVIGKICIWALVSIASIFVAYAQIRDGLARWL